MRSNFIVSFKKINLIVITGSILGLFFNYFNPVGIPLIREETKLNWAEDSLINHYSNNPLQIHTNNHSPTKTIETQTSDDTVLVEKPDNQKHSEMTIAETKNNSVRKDISEHKVEAFNEPIAVNLQQALSLFNTGVTFIDARDETDYQIEHIKDAVNIPFEDFDNHKQKLVQLSKDKPLVIYCAGTDCDLSIMLGNLLFEEGYKQVYIFFGGWLEWENAGYPVEKSQVN